MPLIASGGVLIIFDRLFGNFAEIYDNRTNLADCSAPAPVG